MSDGSFSALQRAEIAEIIPIRSLQSRSILRFSALQRAEIAEMGGKMKDVISYGGFQCSSTSRNC